MVNGRSSREFGIWQPDNEKCMDESRMKVIALTRDRRYSLMHVCPVRGTAVLSSMKPAISIPCICEDRSEQSAQLGRTERTNGPPCPQSYVDNVYIIGLMVEAVNCGRYGF